MNCFFEEIKRSAKFFLQVTFINLGGTVVRWMDRSEISPLSFLSNQLSYRSGHEGDTRNSNTGAQYFESQQWDGLTQTEFKGSRIHLVGLRVIYSEWQSQNGHVIHNDVLPHFWTRPFAFVDGADQHNFDVGYEMTWHRARGPNALRSQLDHNDRSEHRMNWRYSLKMGEKLKVNLLLTFDLDEFGTGETWEGGALQFSTLF